MSSPAFEDCKCCLVCCDTARHIISIKWNVDQIFECGLCDLCMPAYYRWRSATPNDEMRGKLWWDAADGACYRIEEYMTEDERKALNERHEICLMRLYGQ